MESKHITCIKLVHATTDEPIANVHPIMSAAAPASGDVIRVREHPACVPRLFRVASVRWDLEILDYDNYNWTAIVDVFEVK